jgi:hypothetical protein
MAVREPIYVALWTLFLNHPNLVGQFVTTARYKRHFEDVDPTNMPALFLSEVGESWVKPGRGIRAKRVLQAMLAAYVATNQPNSVLPATLINAVMDTVDEVIESPGNPQNVQTLGGLVDHVYLEGQVEIYEGYLQDVSIVLVPLTIMLP